MVVTSAVLVCRMVGEMGWMLFVIVKRFFFAAMAGVDGEFVLAVAGDFEVDADRLFETWLALVDALLLAVAVRFGEGGRVTSSLTVVDVSTVKDGAVESMASEDSGEEFELLLMVRKDEDVDVVVIDEETGLLMIRRGVVLATSGLPVDVLETELACAGKFGGVELPDEERMSEMELERSWKRNGT